MYNDCDGNMLLNDVIVYIALASPYGVPMSKEKKVREMLRVLRRCLAIRNTKARTCMVMA
jgi:hypothetical protein